MRGIRASGLGIFRPGDRRRGVVIPGEGPMNLLPASNGTNRVDDVPLIDSLACTMKATDLVVASVTGIAHSRDGWFDEAANRSR